jgi:2-alkenal reductase
MDRRRFSLTAILGCGLLLLLVVVAIPAIFLFSFGNANFDLGPLIPETGDRNTGRQETGRQETTSQQAAPTFTPAAGRGDQPPANEGPSVPGAVSSEMLANLYNQVNPGVVSLAVNVERGGLVGAGAGSGFLIDKQGHVVTNNHVVSGASSVVVTFFDGTQLSAEVVGTDADSDLAVVKVDQLPENVRPLPLGDSEQVAVGEWVVAIGNPFALNNSMTTGIISAIGRTIPTETTPFVIPKVIQTDAAINPGNSGGPLLNLHGEVIGVNAQIATGGGTPANAGVGFAIPSNIVRLVAPSLIANGDYDWPWLGVEGTTVGLAIRSVNDLGEQRGAYIDSVVNGSPAEAAGLRGSTGTELVDGLEVPVGGDVVIEAEGQPVNSFDALLNIIAFKQPRESLNLTIIRDGQSQQVTVELAPRPENLGP